MGVSIIMCLVLCEGLSGVTGEPWSLDDENVYALPDNYQPEIQHLDLEFKTKDNVIRGNTTIIVTNMLGSQNSPIVVNTIENNITRVEVQNDKDQIIDSCYFFVTENETMVINLKKSSPKLKLYFEFSRLVNNSQSKGLFGGYNPDKDGGLATLFFRSFARTLFPCFDEPRFRSKFSLTITVSQDPTNEFSLVLFNSKKRENSEKNVHVFEETVDLPTYLLCFAVLKGDKYPVKIATSYFEIPITVYAYSESVTSMILNQEMLETVAEVVRFTIAYCETKFGVKWQASEKIDILFINMESSVGAMEHPGLITISDHLYGNSVYADLPHELIHQWTGILISNNWWSNYWINEGLTVYITAVVEKLLTEYKRLSPSVTSVHVPSHLQEYEIRPNVQSALAKEKLEFHGFSGEFYEKAGRMSALLDVAMNDQLLSCLGLIMRDQPFISASSKFILDQLSECPYSDVNATEFMRFWLFEDEIPILKVGIDGKEENKLFRFSYSYLCNFSTTASGESCGSVDVSRTPEFSLGFTNSKGEVIGFDVMVLENNTLLQPGFNVSENRLFFVNIFNRPNFVTQYPDSVYLEFFNWVDNLLESKRRVSKFYSFFVMDIYELSTRNIINIKWLVKIVEYSETFTKVGISTSQDSSELDDIQKFKQCLDQNLQFKLEGEDQKELQKFLCSLYYPEECNLEVKYNKESDYCDDWATIFGKEFVAALLVGNENPVEEGSDQDGTPT